MLLGKKAMLLPILLLFSAFAFTASGTPFTSLNQGTTCPTPSTVGAYVSLPVACETGNIDSYIAFSGFVESASADSMKIQALASSGFYFPANEQGPANFMVGFNAQVFNAFATGITFDVTAYSPPQGHSSVTLYECSGNAMDCLTNPNMTVTIGPSSPAQTIHFAPTAQLGLLFVGNVDAVSTLTQFEATIIGGSGPTGTTGTGGNTPEPATLLLAGLGLVGLGLIRLRKN